MTPSQQHYCQGDEILITEAEYHSNIVIVPWQTVTDLTGAVLIYVPAASLVDPAGGGLDIAALAGLVTPNTNFVSFHHTVHTCECRPQRYDITRCLSKGTHMKVDVQSPGVDFVFVSGHKMCGPMGIGFLWGQEGVLNSMAPYRDGGEMIDEIYMTHSSYACAPSRFEAGGTSPIAQDVGD